MVNEREKLSLLVDQWNENRLDLFHLSYPTEDLEIEGVMRFYFQDGGERVLTKCVRVSSTATTRAVVEALSEKFLPDLKMLSNDTYSLWEVHENGDERRLDEEEKPLLVQLNWHRDDREGRFLLRRDKGVPIPLSAIQLQEADARGGRFSKKKDKELKKKHQKEIVTVNSGREEAMGANDIYKQVPFNTFTRTISNPEAVMRKRRERKLETKLKDMIYGGSVKVFGGDIVPSRPYVTILAGIHDRADKILIEALEKYGLEQRVDDFVLVEVSTMNDSNRSVSDVREIDGGRVITPDECPLMQMAARANENGFDSYLAIRHRPSDYQVPTSVMRQSMTSSTYSEVTIPTLTVLNPDGTPTTHRIVLREGLTEVGCDKALSDFSQYTILIEGPEIRPRHAAITFMDGVVTLTPSTSDAYIEVNGVLTMQTSLLRDGDVVRIGAANLFSFGSGEQSQNFVNGHDSRASTTRINSEMNSSAHENYANSISGSSMSSRHPSELMNNHQASISVNSPYTNGFSTSFSPVRLPISFQIGDYKVWDFLGEVMSRGFADSGSFRLSPAYALYLALRFFHSHTKAYLVQFFARIEANLKQIATECTSRDELLFWLANASELNYLVDRDPDLRPPRAGKLSMEIERVFRRLCTVLLGATRPATRPMLDLRLSDEEGSAELILLLDSTLRAARSSRLNAALTIQVAGHMLHTVNAFIFNHLVGVGVVPVMLTTRLGKSLQARLAAVHRWAEGMGVELAAECHLDRSRQAANLLAANKNDVAALGATCYKLNSLQIHHLLSNFTTVDGEVPCDNDVIERVVRLAQKQADQLTVEDGQAVTLDERDELNLPFLIPQDGYTAEVLQDAPEGLTQYLLGLQERRVCHSVGLVDRNDMHASNGAHPTSSSSVSTAPPTATHVNGTTTTSHGVAMPAHLNMSRSGSQSTLTSLPTTHFGDSMGSSPDDLVRVTLHRGGGGIGLSIVAAQGYGDKKMGIYVKKVVEGTPAALDGRLSTGDQLLSVNKHSLVGISQEDAAKLMTSSGPEVSFEVRKGAAHKNGLNSWLVAGTPTGPTNGVPPPPPPPCVPASPALSSAQAPPSYSNFAPTSKGYGSQQSVDAPPTYQQRYQPASSRSTPMSVAGIPPALNAQHYQQHVSHHEMHQQLNQPNNDFVDSQQPHRHFRSNSASDLHHNDPNASYSQRSTTSGHSVFDKLPAHYRHSARPTVIQPGRPSAQSPSSLRRHAVSPTPLSAQVTTSIGGTLYRPSSASNLFAPPRQNNPLLGYSSNSARDSNHDIYRALQEHPPVAQSSPRDDYRNLPPTVSSTHNNYSASLPQPLNNSSRPASMYGYMGPVSSNQRPSSTVPLGSSNRSPPRVSVAHNTSSNYAPLPVYGSRSSQEPVVVRPIELGTREIVRREWSEETQTDRQTTSFGVLRGAVPTAITQALQLQQEQGGNMSLPPPRAASQLREPRERGVDADVRQLEKTNIALMSYEAVNDELDRLDVKGINMTEEETKRYRELLNVAAEQSRTKRMLNNEGQKSIPIAVQHVVSSPPSTSSSTATASHALTRPTTLGRRTETVIDDVSLNGHSPLRENISPRYESTPKSVQFVDLNAFDGNDAPLIDSPGIVGAHEIYRDPRQRRLNEIQQREAAHSRSSDGASLAFRDKQKLFANGDSTPKQRLAASSAQRMIETDQT